MEVTEVPVECAVIFIDSGQQALLLQVTKNSGDGLNIPNGAFILITRSTDSHYIEDTETKWYPLLKWIKNRQDSHTTVKFTATITGTIKTQGAHAKMFPQQTDGMLPPSLPKTITVVDTSSIHINPPDISVEWK